jgi:hypothetical protein
MNNKAYELLKDWVNDGGGYWYHDTSADVWYLNLRYAARSYSPNDAGFREDVKQLLADAEAGRKLREWLLKDAEIRRNMRDNNQPTYIQTAFKELKEFVEDTYVHML